MVVSQEHVDDALRAARHAQAAAEEALIRAERALGEARLAEAATGAAIDALIEVVDVRPEPGSRGRGI